MNGIAKTIQDLDHYRRQWLRSLPTGLAEGAEVAGPAPQAVVEIADFGPNPGRLRMLAYVPERLPPKPAVVVVLHGCRQTAEGYGAGSGWLDLAEREGFILCLPEQQRGNNPNHCFSWFREADTARGEGEAASIHAMVEQLAQTYGADRKRLFVTGLSAGGAMAAAMLAAYPDVFAAGAVIAGLPYRAAVSVGGALEVMANGDRRSAPEAAAAVRGASDHRGPWPRLSVWHGTADQTVTHSNGGALIRQWRALNGLRAAPSREDACELGVRRVWTDAAGQALLEEYVLLGFGHGTPLDAATLGQPGPFILEAGISSTLRIAEFLGLAPMRRGLIRQALRATGL